MTHDVSDPLLEVSTGRTFWTTVNTAEARPGVSTPLNQSFWSHASELGTRQAFADLGVLSTDQVKVEAPDLNVAAMFYGRSAANVDTCRRIADAMPGTNGDAFEAALFGSSREGIPINTRRDRLPHIAARLPRMLLGNSKRMSAGLVDYERWWGRDVRDQPPSDRGAAVALMKAAETRFQHAFRLHMCATFLAQGIYDQVRDLAAAAGHPELGPALTSGLGKVAEVGIATDLWQASRGTTSLGDVVQHWGFHGPAEGELSSVSWREDLGALKSAVDSYGALGADRDPTATSRTQDRARANAEHQLLTALPAYRRPAARLVLKLARRLIPDREIGKAIYVMSIDGARCAARVIGRVDAQAGVIKDPEDVFMMTIAELVDPPVDPQDVIDVRRERYEHYKTLELPETWYGNPEAIAIDTTSLHGTVVTGIGVSSGVTEGVVRVVLDPSAESALEPDEILVCATTDPSWVSLFVLAKALIIDVGGPLSHGAIVARELGVPCVINTRTGTRALQTGDRVRVDGTNGEVTRIDDR